MNKTYYSQKDGVYTQFDLTDDEKITAKILNQYVWCSNIIASISSPMTRFKDESIGHWIARLHRYKMKYPPFEPVKPVVPTLRLACFPGSCGVSTKYRVFECEPWEDFPRTALRNCTGLYEVPIVGSSIDYFSPYAGVSSGIRLQNVF